MATEDSRLIGRRVMELLDRRNLDAVVAMYSPDAAFYGFTEQPLDREGYRQWIAAFLDAFPDSRFSVDDVIAEGDNVAVRHTFRGTHRQELQGIRPTGRRVEVSGIALFHVRDGRPGDTWLQADLMGMMQQLGVTPIPQ